MNGMNLYQSQFRRLALLDREIRRRKHPNAFTFASEYGVSRRTVARDIQLLKERGAPIEYDPLKTATSTRTARGLCRRWR